MLPWYNGQARPCTIPFSSISVLDCQPGTLMCPPQIGDILVADPQLAKEILYDMRQAENVQRLAAEEAASATAALPGSVGGADALPTGGRLVSLRTPGVGRLGRASDLRHETLMRSMLGPGSTGRGGCLSLLPCSSPIPLPQPHMMPSHTHLQDRHDHDET